MLIQAFEWDDANREHIGVHGVRLDEVEEALLGRCRIARTRDGYYVALGRSDAGRNLHIVFEYRGGGVVRPSSAREMIPRERRFYGKNI